MAVFKKRVFTPMELVKRIGLAGLYLPYLLRGILRPATSRALREKVMLAVTSVNDCRYCSWAHTHLALSNGVDVDELNQLLAHEGVKVANDADGAAVLFAQHYADTNGSLEPGAEAALRQYFSVGQIREIKSYIHAIYIGNLAGNTFDALLARFKGDQVEGSSWWFELLCSLLTAPVLVLIWWRARGDKKVELEAL